MKRMTKLANEKSTTRNMQYTDEWFRDDSNRDFDWEDFKAIKERLEHLPKMMDELNELLKSGERRKADHLALRMSYYMHKTYTAIKTDYEYMSWGRADEMVTY